MKRRKKKNTPETPKFPAFEPPAETRSRKMFSWFLLGLALVFVYIVGCHADSVAKQFLFHPTRYPEGFWDESKQTFEDIRFQNARNQMLDGRYFALEKIAPGENPKGSILYCHGNAENVSHLTQFAEQLRNDLRCNVLVFDYAGYGRSEGQPTAVGILDDGRAARDWLAVRDGIPKDKVIVYGQSLGGSVAVDIAAKDGARALIVESSFTSLGDMGRRMLPFLPVNWLLKERLASVEKIGVFQGPVFVSHGKADQVIPFSQGERLFEAAIGPKIFYIPPEMLDYHSAPHSREHREKLQAFVESLSLPNP